MKLFERKLVFFFVVFYKVNVILFVTRHEMVEHVSIFMHSITTVSNTSLGEHSYVDQRSLFVFILLGAICSYAFIL